MDVPSFLPIQSSLGMGPLEKPTMCYWVQIGWFSDDGCDKERPTSQNSLFWRRYRYPLVIQHNYGKSSFFMGKFTISMVIFHSYFDITRGYLRFVLPHPAVIGSCLSRSHKWKMSMCSWSDGQYSSHTPYTIAKGYSRHIPSEMSQGATKTKSFPTTWK